MQTTSKRGLAEIAAHEGIVLSRYKDSVGVWTIGIGHTAYAGGLEPANFHGELTTASAMALFATDIQKYEARVRKAFGRELPQHQFDAAVSFDFNTGAIHKAKWVHLFNAGNGQAARSSFMNWRKPKEIIPRRQKERDLFFDGKYSGDGYANAYPATPNGRVLWGQGRRMKLEFAEVPDFSTQKPRSNIWARLFAFVLKLIGAKK